MSQWTERSKWTQKLFQVRGTTPESCRAVSSAPDQSLYTTRIQRTLPSWVWHLRMCKRCAHKHLCAVTHRWASQRSSRSCSSTSEPQDGALDPRMSHRGTAASGLTASPGTLHRFMALYSNNKHNCVATYKIKYVHFMWFRRCGCIVLEVWNLILVQAHGCDLLGGFTFMSRLVWRHLWDFTVIFSFWRFGPEITPKT